ncbi:hypothetical protein ACFWYW_47130 [Nonomuraea sp. NPDC059023]|uniref:hypothetical protein n=1 Tax=unclassified Nonomuraea TaxID=2593643 RepID=UPI0036C4F105
MTTTRVAGSAHLPRWRCRLSPCPTRGIWRDAPTRQAAGAALRRHYLDNHWEQPAGARR